MEHRVLFTSAKPCGFLFSPATKSTNFKVDFKNVLLAHRHTLVANISYDLMRKSAIKNLGFKNKAPAARVIVVFGTIGIRKINNNGTASVVV